MVDCVAAAAPHANHFDDRFLGLCIDELDHLHLLCAFLMDSLTFWFSGCFCC
jgi:hypothetical protein